MSKFDQKPSGSNQCQLPARVSRREATALLGFHSRNQIRALIKRGLLQPLGDVPIARSIPKRPVDPQADGSGGNPDLGI